jgi:hypothetical protein
MVNEKRIESDGLSLDTLEYAGSHMRQVDRVYLAALEYIRCGYRVIPLGANSKKLPSRAHGVSYTSASKELSVINSWFNPEEGSFAGWNIGIATGMEDGVFALDIDKHEAKDGFLVLAAQELIHGKIKDTPSQITPNGGLHYLFRWSSGLNCSTDKVGVGVDTRGGTKDTCKGHIVAFPSIVNGKEYKWERGGDLSPTPCWVGEALGVPTGSQSKKELFESTAPLYIKSSSSRGNENIVEESIERPIDYAQMKRMLEYIDPNNLQYDGWVRVGMSIHSQMSDSTGLELWNTWSKRGDRYKLGECEARWGGFDSDGKSRAGTVCFLAKEGGWIVREDEVTTNPSDMIVQELNKTYALVTIGGKVRIMKELEDAEVAYAGQPRYSLMEVSAWEMVMANRYITVDEKKVPLSKIWTPHTGRRTYSNGLGLYPSGDAPKNCYNTWRGFAVKPKEGDCSLFINHIEEVLCKGDKKLSSWVLDWMADLIQDTGKPKGCALVMRGQEGAGKGVVASALGRLVSSNYIHLTDDAHLTGNFNAHMSNAVLMFADEITWGGNKKSAGKLKGLITERNLMTERKGVDAVMAHNSVHVIISSNSDWVIPAGAESRRWLVLDVANTHVGDESYFDKLHDQMEFGGDQALMHFLLNRKITNSLRTAMETDALREQRALSQDCSSAVDWWSRMILRGQFLTPEESEFDPEKAGSTWAALVTKSAFYEEYEQWCLERKERVVKYIPFCTELKKLGVVGARQSRGKKPTFAIASLEECRELMKVAHPLQID